MAYENVKLRRRNVTVDQGYFFMIDEGQDNLLQKTDDGNTAFSYPLDTLLSKEVLSLEFDGVYFWSLEDGANADETVIRRWLLDNYICKLQETITLSSGTQYGGEYHKFESEAFTIEHYHDTLYTTSVSGTDTLMLNSYWDHDTMQSGTRLHIGPNSDGYSEDVVVTATISGGVTIFNESTVSGTLKYTYDADDEVNYYTNLWVFNNYNVDSSTEGALYKFDAHTKDYVTKYSGGAFKDIKACTFYNVNSFDDYGNVDTICYIKGTNTLFVNPTEIEGFLTYYGSMVMDNIEDDDITIIAVYDLAMDDQNVYRLQSKATYDDATSEWGTNNYSYQLSSLDSFVTSISLSANPAIIAANQISTSTIIAIVKDQFLQPVKYRAVTFDHTDTSGGAIIGGNPINTNAEGKASTIYRAGTDADIIEIEAVVNQV